MLADGDVDAELDGDVDGDVDGEVEGDADPELDGDVDGDRDGLAGVRDGDLGAVLEGARLGRWRWCLRLPTPGGGPGFTGGSVGFAVGPVAPVPGATGTTTPAPAA